MTLSKTFDQDVKDVLKSVYEVVGPLTKLIVKPSEEHQPVIKYRNSFQFPFNSGCTAEKEAALRTAFLSS